MLQDFIIISNERRLHKENALKKKKIPLFPVGKLQAFPVRTHEWCV